MWSGDIWSTKNPWVFGDGVCTGSSCLFLCNLHSQGYLTVVLVPAWQKLEGYVKDVLAEQMGTSLFFAIPTGQKMSSDWKALSDGNKFAYLTMKNSISARFARAFFIFWHFDDVLVLSMTWKTQPSVKIVDFAKQLLKYLPKLACVARFKMSIIIYAHVQKFSHRGIGMKMRVRVTGRGIKEVHLEQGERKTRVSHDSEDT